jgi:hypothetical protein
MFGIGQSPVPTGDDWFYDNCAPSQSPSMSIVNIWTMQAPTAMYAVDIDQKGREGVQSACIALIDTLSPILHDGFIDGYSDFPASAMNQAALDALALIQQRATERASRKRWFGNPTNLMGIDLKMSRAEDRQILRDFGPWSIHAEVYSGSRKPSDGNSVMCFHDSGLSITAELTEEEATRISEQLPDGASLRRLKG